MSKVSKICAFQNVAKAIDKGDYKEANEIMNIINRSINKDKKNNIFSEYVELIGKKEEKYFLDVLKYEEQDS